jgi:hypothetical protein
MKGQILAETFKIMVEIQKLRAERHKLLGMEFDYKTAEFQKNYTRLKAVNERLYELTGQFCYKPRR